MLIYVCLYFMLVSLSDSLSFNPTIQKTWSNRLGVTLTPITTGVWAAERPFVWNGIDVGGRSLICRMNDGSLLVHSPVEWTEDLNKCLQQVGGDVNHIISPNYEHLKYALQWSLQYPNAIKYACPGLPERLPDIKWSVELGYESPIELRESIDISYFDCESNPVTGKPFFNEIVFYHKKSKSVFMADTFWNYPSSSLPNYFGESGTGNIHECSKMPIPISAYNDNNNNNENSITQTTISSTLPAIDVPKGTSAWKFGMDKIYLPFYKNIMVGKKGEKRQKYETAVKKVLNWDVEVIVPCHGDVIRGKELCKQILTHHFLH